MNKALQGVADQIAGTLIHEIADDRQLDRPSYQDMVDRLARMVGEEVSTWIERVNADAAAEVQAVLGRLLEVEKKLENLSSEHDSVPAKEGRSSLPNLKYAKSKYHDVESLLNYVESGEDQAGLKLVIMNFND